MSRDIWDDVAFAGLRPEARLLYLGLDDYADDNGNYTSNPGYLETRFFPSKREGKVHLWLRDLLSAGLIECYSHDDAAYVHLVKKRLPRIPKNVAFPLAPGQEHRVVAPKVKPRFTPADIPDAMRLPVDSFVTFCAHSNASGKITDGRVITIQTEIAELVARFGMPAVVLGLTEAVSHNAPSTKYVAAVARNFQSTGTAQGQLQLVGGSDTGDARDKSLTELRRRR